MTDASGNRSATFGIVALLAATLFWSGNYVVGGEAVASITPLDLTTMRWTIALVPLILMAQVVEHPDWRSAIRAWPHLVLPAILGLLAYTLFLYTALEHTTAVNASLINAFNPAMISIAAAIFLHQRLTPIAVGGILLALLGVLWVLSDGHLSTLFTQGFGIGDLLMIGAITVWTAYTLLGRHKTGVPPITATALQAAITVVIMMPIVLAMGGPHIPAEPGPRWALLYIGLFPSVAAYGLWNMALTSVPPARAGVFLNMLTVFTVIISVMMGKPFTLAQGVGGIVILAGVALANIEAFRQPPSQSRLKP